MKKNTNQPTQKKIIWRRNKSISATLFFLYEWMKPRKETQQEKLFEKKMKKRQSRPV